MTSCSQYFDKLGTKQTRTLLDSHKGMNKEGYRRFDWKSPSGEKVQIVNIKNQEGKSLYQLSDMQQAEKKEQKEQHERDCENEWEPMVSRTKVGSCGTVALCSGYISASCSPLGERSAVSCKAIKQQSSFACPNAKACLDDSTVTVDGPVEIIKSTPSQNSQDKSGAVNVR